MRDIVIEEDTYEGKPVLSLSWADDDRYPFNFGLAKAKLLAAALNENPDFLMEFIRKHKK